MKTNVINCLLLYISKKEANLLLIDSSSWAILPIKEYSNAELADAAKYLIELGYLRGIWKNSEVDGGYTCWVKGLTDLGQEYVQKYLEKAERNRQHYQKIKQQNQKILAENKTIIQKTEEILVKSALIVAESRKLRCCTLNYQPFQLPTILKEKAK